MGRRPSTKHIQPDRKSIPLSQGPPTRVSTARRWRRCVCFPPHVNSPEIRRSALTQRIPLGKVFLGPVREDWLRHDVLDEIEEELSVPRGALCEQVDWFSRKDGWADLQLYGHTSLQGIWCSCDRSVYASKSVENPMTDHNHQLVRRNCRISDVPQRAPHQDVLNVDQTEVPAQPVGDVSLPDIPESHRGVSGERHMHIHVHAAPRVVSRYTQTTYVRWTSHNAGCDPGWRGPPAALPAAEGGVSHFVIKIVQWLVWLGVAALVVFLLGSQRGWW